MPAAEADAGTQTDAGASTEPAAGEGTDPGEGGADSVAGAPEEYADFTAPEGFALDADLTSEFKAIAKGLNLPQEAAQQVVDMGFKLLESAANQHVQQLNDARVAWADQTKADPDIGGDKLTDTLATARKARDTFASPGLVKLLEDSGLGNHPEIIRAFSKIGAAISEDKLVTGGSNATPETSVADKFFPSMTPK